ncbi:hypothetical protein JHK87_045136 [Glycine soja]|nr:hypothetical protein JHK87_045136 [Glycine soja]
MVVALRGGGGSCCIVVASGIKVGLALSKIHSSSLRNLSKNSFMPVTPLVSLLTHTPAPDMHRPVNNNFHHVSSGMPLALNTQSQQENFGI